MIRLVGKDDYLTTLNGSNMYVDVPYENTAVLLKREDRKYRVFVRTNSVIYRMATYESEENALIELERLHFLAEKMTNKDENSIFIFRTEEEIENEKKQKYQI